MGKEEKLIKKVLSSVVEIIKEPHNKKLAYDGFERMKELIENCYTKEDAASYKKSLGVRLNTWWKYMNPLDMFIKMAPLIRERMPVIEGEVSAEEKSSLAEAWEGMEFDWDEKEEFDERAEEFLKNEEYSPEEKIAMAAIILRERAVEKMEENKKNEEREKDEIANSLIHGGYHRYLLLLNPYENPNIIDLSGLALIFKMVEKAEIGEFDLERNYGFLPEHREMIASALEMALPDVWSSTLVPLVLEDIEGRVEESAVDSFYSWTSLLETDGLAQVLEYYILKSESRGLASRGIRYLDAFLGELMIADKSLEEIQLDPPEALRSRLKNPWKFKKFLEAKLTHYYSVLKKRGYFEEGLEFELLQNAYNLRKFLNDDYEELMDVLEKGVYEEE